MRKEALDQLTWMSIQHLHHVDPRRNMRTGSIPTEIQLTLTNVDSARLLRRPSSCRMARLVEDGAVAVGDPVEVIARAPAAV